MDRSDLSYRFKEYVKSNSLIASEDKVLAAVSGGMDSVVMCELMSMNNIPFDVAHVNFRLRGKESDEDEKFVKELAINYGVSFYTTGFDTSKHARMKGVSVEMAARELRYSFFNSLCVKKKYDLIAVAHHRNDNVETILLNLVKGTGIRGLHGILPKVRNIVRPLLFATRSEIEKFADECKINYRADSSNDEVKYQRNLIRHKVVPELKFINPALEKTITESSGIFKSYESIINDWVESNKKDIVLKKAEKTLIDINNLLMLDSAEVFLYEVLSKYGFNIQVVREILDSLRGESGKKFISKEYIIVKDRQYLIIEKKKKREDVYKLITEDTGELTIDNVGLKLMLLDYDEFDDLKDSNVAYFDYGRLSFPLVIRNWQEGDYFCPYGMKGTKKLSDYFVDRKVSLIDKEKILVIESGGEIIWVVGDRTDNRYKIDENCRKVLKIVMMQIQSKN